ncbi:MAG: insulinase family protein, partial [Pseudomonadota bacterium]
KKHLVGGYPLKLAGNRKIADQVAYIAFYELPLDWLDTFTARVETVTIEQIRDAFQRRVRLNELVTVTVGGR